MRLHLVSFRFILDKHAKPSLACLETTKPPTFTEESQWSGTVPGSDMHWLGCRWVAGFLGPPTTLYISKSSSFESFARSSWRQKICWEGEGPKAKSPNHISVATAEVFKVSVISIVGTLSVHQTQKLFGRACLFFPSESNHFVGRSDGKPMLHLLQKQHPARLNLFGGSSRVAAQIAPMISLCNGT